MSIKTADYSKTVMYKIVSKDETIPDMYIGHTTNIKQRRIKHYEGVIYFNPKKDYKVYKFIRANGGWDNFNLVVIEEYPCSKCDEARLRERYWYDLLNPTLNDRKPICSKMEYCILTKDKKQLYDIERRKQTMICECGHTIQIARKSEHLKSNHTKRIVK